MTDGLPFPLKGSRVPQSDHECRTPEPAQSSEERSAFERLRRRLCGKCVSAHIRVMRCFSQVFEASFHCVTFWNHAGLPALPSAAVRHSIADNLAATELLQVCSSPTSPPVFASGGIKAVHLWGPVCRSWLMTAQITNERTVLVCPVPSAEVLLCLPRRDVKAFLSPCNSREEKRE